MDGSIHPLVRSNHTCLVVIALFAVIILPPATFATSYRHGVPSRVPVRTLQSGVLRAGEVPPPFTTPHVRTYAAFRRRMAVPTTQAGVPSSQSSCTVPGLVAHDGYAQGLIEGFDSTAVAEALVVCSWRFLTGAGAHRAYGPIHADLSRNVRSGKFQSLSFAPIGDESVGLGTTHISARIGAIVFRHANAVVALKVVTTRPLSASAFAHLASLVNQRLR